MTYLTSEQFAEYITNLEQQAPPFKPVATYDPDGDCIEFLAAPVSFYGKRIDDLVTVYYDNDTNEIVGSLIKGIRRMLKRFPGFRIEIQDGPVRLEHLFRAHLWTSNPQSVETVTTYTKLIAMAEENEAKAELAGMV